MPVRRVLVCPQEFKGSLDPSQAAGAIARGVRAALPDAKVVERPLADGGPGTALILAEAYAASIVAATVPDAYGAPVEATFALADPADGRGLLGIIESAAAVGLLQTPPERRVPALASSEGVGHLMRLAVEAGARRLLVCVGGTGSVDGGSGVARSLGLRLLDCTGRELPAGGLHLVRLDRIEDHVEPLLRAAEVAVAVDARNILTGPEGAVAIFGAQKGVPDWQAPALEAALRRWAVLVRASLAREIETVPGAGTGGGITAGILAALPRTRVRSGAALVAEAVHLEALVREADLVVTGEGSLDAQTAYGKTVSHVAALAARHGVPCVAVAGLVEARPDGLADVEALAGSTLDIATAIADAPRRAEAAARRLVGRIVEGLG